MNYPELELDHPSSSGEKFVAFFLGEALYAIPVDRVSEVVNLPAVARLPNSPRFLSGITNVRGGIVAVLNLKALAGENGTGASTKPKLVVLQALPTDTRIAFEADRMHEIVTLDLIDMRPADAGASRHIAATIPRDGGFINIVEPRFLIDELQPAR